MGNQTFIPLPDGWQPDRNILKGVELGEHLGATSTLVADAYRTNTIIWGPVGAGSTNLMRVYLANLIAKKDVTLWLIDPDGSIADDFLQPVLSNESLLPAFDWVATTWDEIVTLAGTAAALADQGHDDSRAVIVVVASGAPAMGLDGATEPTPAGKTVRDHLTAVAAAGNRFGQTRANVNVLLQLKRLTGLGDMLRVFDTFIALHGADRNDLTTAFGSSGASDELLPARFNAAIIDGADRINRFQPYYISPEKVTHYALAYGGAHTVDDGTADRLGSQYQQRWQRTLPRLFNSKPIPEQLNRLGQPTMPTDLDSATHRQLAHALYTSPSVNSDGQHAAATILLHACGHELIHNPIVHTALTIEDGQLYVRWPKLVSIAEMAESGHYPKGPKHPDAGIMLRLAAHMATGSLTEANISLLMVALDYYTDDDEPEGATQE